MFRLLFRDGVASTGSEQPSLGQRLGRVILNPLESAHGGNDEAGCS